MERVVRRQVSRTTCPPDFRGECPSTVGSPCQGLTHSNPSAGSYPRHLRNTQLLSTTTLFDLLSGRATLSTSIFKENKHIPAKWLKILRELVIKILVFDVYKTIIIWGGFGWFVCLGFFCFLILLIVLGIELLGFLFVILRYENCCTNTGNCQARK